MTTRQLLSASLNALFHERKVTMLQAAQATGIDNATISKFQSKKDHLWRWPTEQHFDALAAFFRVQPYVLLKPDEALAGRYPDSGSALSAHGTGPSSDSVVTSPLPLVERRADVPDAALFRKLTAYWTAMEPAQQAELVRLAWELSNPGADRPAVGFKRG